jgi:hypothetical protein
MMPEIILPLFLSFAGATSGSCSRDAEGGFKHRGCNVGLKDGSGLDPGCGAVGNVLCKATWRRSGGLGEEYI